MPTRPLKPEENLAIIGGGPAGIAAGIQLYRQGASFVLYEKEILGGLLAQAGWIENYPGFPEGIRGDHLARLFRRQIARLPVDIRSEEITALDYDPQTRRFLLGSDRGCSSFERVIVASGTKPRGLPFPTPSDPRLSSRIYFDWRKIPAGGATRVAVIGAGDIALDCALSLKSEHNVAILCRGEKCRALPLLHTRVLESQAVDLLFQTEIACLVPGRERPLRLSGAHATHGFVLEADYILVAVGREAEKDFYSPRLALRERDLAASGMLFLAGDVQNGGRRQTALAVGDGLAAALAVAGTASLEPL